FYIRQAFKCFSSRQAARAAFTPLLRALEAAPRNLRPLFFEGIINKVRKTRQNLRSDLATLICLLPRLLEFDEAAIQSDYLRYALNDSALTLNESVPEQACLWMEWILRLAADRIRGKEEVYEECSRLELGVRLGAAVA